MSVIQTIKKKTPKGAIKPSLDYPSKFTGQISTDSFQRRKSVRGQNISAVVWTLEMHKNVSIENFRWTEFQRTK